MIDDVVYYVAAAEFSREKGATRIYVIASHGKPFFNHLSQSLESYENQLLTNDSLDSISVNQLIRKINQLQQVHRLPKPNNWITCRGSNPIYRGYTCSLWLLWHTLSVAEYLQVDGQLTNHQVAFTMRSFIRDFFSCQECRQHFINETIDMFQVIHQSDPFSSIRYLWSVHNSVNKRIAGDPTQDPFFPKVQFPLQTQCSNCWTRGRFNDNQVIQYLINRYNPSNWIPCEKTKN
ncbi:sulfhydryl oxidase 2-like [Panonychus citri]|uniref:sulfhydryl oxidase 2-like n=1 Tax=Panonychus citri TaxID=50023 RepID=UPI0023080B44|nr:sulfhydryl oxidase 2-like [Panonychus citri]